MSLLHLKIALALQRGRSEVLRITRSALAAFLKDHLGRWFPAICFGFGGRRRGSGLSYDGETFGARGRGRRTSFNVVPTKARAGTDRGSGCWQQRCMSLLTVERAANSGIAPKCCPLDGEMSGPGRKTCSNSRQM